MKLSMGLSGPRLRAPADPALRENHIYGVPTLYQVSPTAVACVANIRVIGVGQVDFENGADAILFDSLDSIDAAKAVPLVRNRTAVDPDTGERIVLVMHAPNGGFVPLGARLPDGRPHPAAGTGFGFSSASKHLESTAFGASPTAFKSRLRSHPLLLQYRYDGVTFKVVSGTPIVQESFFPGWTTLGRGLGGAVPDGEDLLFGLVGGQDNDAARAHRARLAKSGRPLHPHAGGPLGECYGSLCSRWRYGQNGWQPVSYVSVTASGPDMAGEPSLVRDRDGSLLFSVRGKGAAVPPGECDEGLENTYEHFRVYRSRDAGATWERVIHLAERRSPTPVVINSLKTGEPYIAANPFKGLLKDDQGRTIYKTRVREELMAWPLTADRRDVEKPVMLLDANAQFGKARQYDEMGHANHWHLDHPEGGTFRLRDGRWHSLLGFRCTDTALCGFGIAPPPQAGAWIEELTCEGDAVAPWNF
jgi:hypothetical protein